MKFYYCYLFCLMSYLWAQTTFCYSCPVEIIIEIISLPLDQLGINKEVRREPGDTEIEDASGV